MVPRPFTLKPPRQPSVIEDEEQISVDGYTYRHMQQDMTMFKTMLLKLKRVIQEVRGERLFILMLYFLGMET